MKILRWIKDEEFIRGNIPMTKFEARIITIGMLEIEKGDVFLDIGGGTGSISIEASLQGAKTYVIEKEDEGIDLIRKNSERFNIEDIEIIKNIAPLGIDNIHYFNKCFIGGSSKRLEEIVRTITDKIAPDGILVANFITLNNLTKFQSLLKQNGYRNIETRLIQASIVDEKTGLLKAQNPIFIVRGIKG
ncbi:precorrin-6Y C5,15-methyltransferase (decarboxylating) subunit CbiT [Gottschalkia acidurici]|uniref:precorrin-6Y C5,15-methyltransferase (decarboxylating) subunit CbiT n=1 Tax=Clostridium acidurici TaxID=1556 RepID=UPI003B831FB6